ncbi:hypothetical protein C8Q79DRAFT_563952 [Trametes meyenii]|nr:hypothetical protein C8Q79DRAFT_563952 [Trametes meyenii]
MHAKTVVIFFFPILAALALPAKRDDLDDALSLITAADTNTAASAELNSILNSSPSTTFDLPGSPLSLTGAALATAEASILLEVANDEISALPDPSRTQLTAYVTNLAGTPVVEVSSIGGPAITLATSTGITTTFAGHTVVVAPGDKNGASGLSISRPLLSGIVGVLGAVAAGAMIFL